MSNSVQVIDELLTNFDKEIPIKASTPTINNNTNLKTKSNISSSTNTNQTNPTCNKQHKNGTLPHTSSINQESKPPTPPQSQSQPNTQESKEESKEESKSETKESSELDSKELEELSEEEALRLAMAMSMNDEDRKLVKCINNEIREAQQHLSNWFSGNFNCIKDKNRAWFDFSRRLHHQFEMYRIEQGIIQPLSYQFFIQFIALMYNSMPKSKANNKSNKSKSNKKNKRKNKGKNRNKNENNNATNVMDDTLYIDQHKIRNIHILAADDDAIKYLRFAQGIKRDELKDAVYAKFESLALDPMNPNQWKYNHVMFVRSDKAPNGLLWTKWHMQ